ncbi:MAG TPA: LacI family DNA-binding transcriptional regulator [Rhodocyclaceae bacterium]|nr:LacI family DNA-binding transcriptional regulator [Rhodocyclaceae bacterium]
MNTKRRATIRDVAKAADVSIATISKFMNKLQRYSPDVEARIRRAVDELDYHQSLATRSLISGQTRTVILAVQDIQNPFFTNLFRGASRVALANEYSVLVVDLQENPSGERSLLEGLSRRADGLIVVTRLPDTEWLTKLGKSVVMLGPLRHPGITSINADGQQGAYMLGKHLLETGRRRIAYLGFERDVRKIQGLSAALAEGGLTPTVHTAFASTLEGGERAASTLLLGDQRPDAVVCRNDLIAIGLMHEAQALGLRVPDDIAITGFDNIPVARHLQPALTTIDMRSEEQGEIAMQKLLDAIFQKNTVEDIWLAPHLILRESTRAPIAKSSKAAVIQDVN